ncbi:similar to N-acetylglucosaminyl-phosphatidylinositol de-N-acetylase [Plenodomus lingam JN3]|uniref:N-acetylglucosaminylphosphatidylinositol deacetylase n=1 Tax=Leptosphaeria maculans (strain JN3 / isolate v23.1.3 / race Av1-4-5-6-7-8) TaxID=985895 RepID=E4ZYK6_LEPMJ|nr:similar to N-acetylglucosaminyl-phosphatidylinositol de-N-acetylase [Plenodomus lingam JN3]CBX96532.1 similar to N-acetylglucosaminyl-phosphatidylinositol de-N-acetylase [Plenodomus lingam JN3]
MNWLVWASLPVALLGFWMYTSILVSSSFPTLRNKRILLLIAHPDDEAMFFAPTLLALTQPELANHIKILCLSSGDADGLGEIRKKELVKSGLRLGIASKDDILVIEDHNFPDSMTVTWHPRLISNLLTTAFAPNMSSISAKDAPQTTIDTIITFDTHGISSHPNHRSLHDGAHTFLKALMHRHSAWECPIRLYTLTTTSIFRKYSGILDAPTTIWGATLAKKDVGEFPSPLLFVSSPKGYRTAQSAMTTAHQSQMRWFRWGWIGAARYMVINDLKIEKRRS